ncbi:hypothetical protein LINPERHAP1_LOCUS27492 [Linum perenne]
MFLERPIRWPTFLPTWGTPFPWVLI